MHDHIKNAAACSHLAVIDPSYPKQARDMIDQLTKELQEVQDLVHKEWNELQFIQ